MTPLPSAISVFCSRRAVAWSGTSIRRSTGYRLSAEAGNARAQANLATLYLSGEGVNQDFAEASTWLLRAAEQGHTVAQYNLAILYENGLGVPRDATEALRWYTNAAAGGHPDAGARMRLLLERVPPPEAEPAAPEPQVAAAPPAPGAGVLAPPPENLDPPVDPVVRAEPAAPPAEVSIVAPPLLVAEPVGAAIAVQDMGPQLFPPPPLLVQEAGGGALAADPAAPPQNVPPPPLLVQEAAVMAGRAPLDGAAEPAEAPPQAALPPPPELLVAEARANAAAPAGVDADAIPIAGPDGFDLDPSVGANAFIAVPRTLDGIAIADDPAAEGARAYRGGNYPVALANLLAASLTGDANAQFLLGGMYRDGAGIPPDLALAHLWWTLAAAHDHVAAARYLEVLVPEMTDGQLARAADLLAAWNTRR